MHIPKRRGLAVLLAVAMVYPGLPARAQGAAGSGTPATKPEVSALSVEGTFKSTADGADKVTLSLPKPLNDKELIVDSQEAKDSLAKAMLGDRVKVDVDSTSNPQHVSKVESIARPVRPAYRLLALALGFGILLSAACAATSFRPLRFMIGVDNRYSNSQTQLVLWFGAVASVYFAATVLRVWYLGWDYLSGVGIPEHLLELSGLSALSFGGAKVITSQKVEAAERAGVPPVKVPAAKSNLLSDLVTNDKGNADLGDFQMILVTLSAVVLFLMSAFHFLATLTLAKDITLPDIDSTMLAGFGLGHGAYLVKKAAVKAGDG